MAGMRSADRVRGRPDPVPILAQFAGGRTIAETDCVAAVIAFYRAAGLVDRDLDIITRPAAVELLRAHSRDLVNAAGHVLDRLGWPPVSPSAAQDLDCGVCLAWGQQTMAIARAGRWLAPGPDGVVMLPSAVRAWRAPAGGGNGN